jgi:hypothetical protein
MIWYVFCNRRVTFKGYQNLALISLLNKRSQAYSKGPILVLNVTGRCKSMGVKVGTSIQTGLSALLNF